MKNSYLTMIAVFAASVVLAHGRPENLPVEKISTAVSAMMKEHRRWIAEKPRKLAIQFIEAKDLPEELSKIGFRGAAIEEGFVILISTDEGADPIEGIVFVTDGKDRSELLTRNGWKVTDSSDPHIKNLKKKAQQDGGGQPATRSESK
jgi:ABC-type metal ion transport system substrate-binding protein